MSNIGAKTPRQPSQPSWLDCPSVEKRVRAIALCSILLSPRRFAGPSPSRLLEHRSPRRESAIPDAGARDMDAGSMIPRRFPLSCARSGAEETAYEIVLETSDRRRRAAGARLDAAGAQIGDAWCRERVCQYWYIWVAAV